MLSMRPFKLKAVDWSPYKPGARMRCVLSGDEMAQFQLPCSSTGSAWPPSCNFNNHITREFAFVFCPRDDDNAVSISASVRPGHVSN